MAIKLIDVCNKEIELKRRIKLENEFILDKIEDINEDFNIDKHEVQKFLLRVSSDCSKENKRFI